MMYKLIAGAAALALLGAASAGLAQAQDHEKGRGGDVREAPRAAPERAPNVERSRPQTEPHVQRAPQRESIERAQRAEPRQRERQVPQRAERQRSEPNKQAAPKQGQTPDRAARQNDGPDRKQVRNPERQDRQQVNRVQATNDQRTRVRERVFLERGINRISRKDFGDSINVGSRVNRRHRLYRLTPAILAFAPIYRGYSYIVVDDTICIVDSETYIIVDVIPSSGAYAEGPQRQLVLSADEMRFIYASVPRDRTADVRIRLALGAEVPSRVDLQRFPDGVIERVPQIESFGYIVVDNDVVVVDPTDRTVALVITE